MIHPETLWQDLRYAARRLGRSPGFTLAVVLTVALGVGGTTAVFSFVNALLLRPLPVREPDALVWAGGVTSSGERTMSFSYPEYLELRDGAKPLSGLAAFGMSRFRVGTGDQTVATAGAMVSDNYFAVLGVSLPRGRFGSAPDAADGVPGVVLSDHLWRRGFGADPRVVGRIVRVDGVPVRVAGVAPPGFGAGLFHSRMNANRAGKS